MRAARKLEPLRTRYTILTFQKIGAPSFRTSRTFFRKAVGCSHSLHGTSATSLNATLWISSASCFRFVCHPCRDQSRAAGHPRRNSRSADPVLAGGRLQRAQQQVKVPIIGVLSPSTPSSWAPRGAVFVRGCTNAAGSRVAPLRSSIVGPFASQAAVIIEHAYVGALSPHAKVLRRSDRE
jgi:hypothetical protein